MIPEILPAAEAIPEILPAAEAVPEIPEGPVTAVDSEYVDAFEEVFGRPMLAREYFFWKRRFAGTRELKQNIEEIHDKFVKAFQATSRLHRDYLDEPLLVSDFVKVHLEASAEVPLGVYIERLQARIVASDTYRIKMEANLQRAMTSMYDQTMADSDMVYVLRRVRAKMLSLEDEELTSILSDYWTETDAIATKIHGAHQEILQRMAEPLEVSNKIRAYRVAIEDSNQDPEAFFGELNRELLASLEFHDILKGALRAEKPSLTTSQLYSVLSRVLDKIAKTRVSSVREAIRIVIEALD